TRPSAVFAVLLLAVGVGALGVGNGAVFQVVPRMFPANVGAVTGLVGAAGGLGGFLLPFALGVAKTWTGSYAPGLAAFAVACLSGLASLALANRRWKSTAGLAPEPA